jgi:hypothetical protein
VSDPTTAQWVLDEANSGDDGLVINALVALEVLKDDGERYLVLRRNTDAGTWVHLGMVEAFADDLREAMRVVEDD